MYEMIAAHAIFAATFTLSKLGITYTQPIFFAGVRVLSIGLGCLVFNFLTRKSYWISYKDYGYLIQIFLFQVYFAFIFAFIALPHIPSTTYALIFGFTPFFIAFFSYILGQEIITRQKLFGLSVGFLGFIPTLFLKQDTINTSGLIQFSWAELVMVMSAMSWAYGWTMVKKIQKSKYPSSLVNGITLTFGGCALLLTSLCIGEWATPLVSNLNMFLIALIGTIISSGSSYILNYFFIKKYSVTFVMMMFFIDPLYAALYGRIFLSEHVAWPYFATIGMIFLGLYIYYRQELDQRKNSTNSRSV